MAHNHDHHAHDHSHSTGNIKVAFFLNLFFTVVEIIGGFYTNSLAILSDALHDLGDSLSLGLSWYLQKLSGKGRTKHFSYGYKRFSILAAIINALILIVGAIFILSKAVPQLSDPEPTNAEGMLYLAVLGVIVNGAAVLRLRDGKSLNERMVTLHLLEDVLGWVAVLVGSLIMIFFDAPFIDPLLSILISLFLLYNVIKNLKKTLSVVLQGVPEGVSIESISDRLRNIDGIVDAHDGHIWTMDGQYNILTIHLVLDKDYTLTKLIQLKKTIRHILTDEHISHSTIEFEVEDEACELQDC